MKRLLVLVLVAVAGFAVGQCDWKILSQGPAGEYPVLVRPGAIRIHDAASTGRTLAAFERDRVQLTNPGSPWYQVNIASDVDGGFAQFADGKGKPTVMISGARGSIAGAQFSAGGSQGITANMPYLKANGAEGVIHIVGGIVTGID